MAQIIDFISRKQKKDEQEKENSRTIVDFSLISARNKQSQEKLRKEREIANKNVMKTYKIK